MARSNLNKGKGNKKMFHFDFLINKCAYTTVIQVIRIIFAFSNISTVIPNKGDNPIFCHLVGILCSILLDISDVTNGVNFMKQCFAGS